MPDEIQQQIQERVALWTGVLKPAEGPEAWLVARAAALSARVDAAVKFEAERRAEARQNGRASEGGGQRVRVEAKRPANAGPIDLSRAGERLRRYEVSLDRQLHLALQRAELLRHERTAEVDEPEEARPAGSAGPRAESASRDRRPGREMDADCRVASPPTAEPERRVPEDAFSRRTMRLPSRNEPGPMPSIPPRRRQLTGDEPAFAKASPSGPPLRGRIAGREVLEGRGAYASPEMQRPERVPKMTVRDRVRLAIRGGPTQEDCEVASVSGVDSSGY